jgi:hypothetical protein
MIFDLSRPLSNRGAAIHAGLEPGERGEHRFYY